VKIARNLNAISKLLLVLLLLLAMIIGSIFSYLILVGYYINLKTTIPENTTISVIDVNLDVENAETFNITLLNPTYSPAEATIKEIWAATEDNEAHRILSVNPQLPYELGKGKKETFNCAWNWGDYIGETMKVIVLVEDGSGAVYEIETASVELKITAAVFATDDTKHFNLTIHNPEASVIDLNVTKITVSMENGTVFNVREITPSIPKVLLVDTYNTFKCSWDWTDYRGKNITINVYTSQGYAYHLTKTTPKPAQLSITDAVFDSSNMTFFNITVKNSENSISSANLTTVEVMFTNGTTQEVPVESPPDLPYTLPIGDTVTLKCIWNWADNREETIAITIKTPEGYLGYFQQTIP
jgi:hypothetical protein